MKYHARSTLTRTHSRAFEVKCHGNLASLCFIHSRSRIRGRSNQCPYFRSYACTHARTYSRFHLRSNIACCVREAAYRYVHRRYDVHTLPHARNTQCSNASEIDIRGLSHATVCTMYVRACERKYSIAGNFFL